MPRATSPPPAAARTLVIFVVIVNFPTGVAVSAADAGTAVANAAAHAAARTVSIRLIRILSPAERRFS
jgi:phosphoribosylcarboxyaminoimidazole (NCAIR) mutase